jgi:hypothetical protein
MQRSDLAGLLLQLKVCYDIIVFLACFVVCCGFVWVSVHEVPAADCTCCLRCSGAIWQDCCCSSR